jgi:hypothetical protein
MKLVLFAVVGVVAALAYVAARGRRNLHFADRFWGAVMRMSHFDPHA